MAAPLVLLSQHSMNDRSSQVDHEQQGSRVCLPLPTLKRNGALIPISCKEMGLPAPLIKRQKNTNVHGGVSIAMTLLEDHYRGRKSRSSKESKTTGHPRKVPLYLNCHIQANGQKRDEGPEQMRQRGSMPEVDRDEFLFEGDGYQAL
jgi:hypothetical protein